MYNFNCRRLRPYLTSLALLGAFIDVSIPTPARAEDSAGWLGGMFGTSFSIGRIGSPAMDLPNRSMVATSLEMLLGFQHEAWLFGIDVDYRKTEQLTGLGATNGTNLKANSWIFGLGTSYVFSKTFALQGSLGFLGRYKFDHQTSASENDHLNFPIAFRVKPQLFAFDRIPELTIDLDLRYIRWIKFDVAGDSQTRGTNELFSGLGLTYIFGSRERTAPRALNPQPDAPGEAAPAPGTPNESSAPEANSESLESKLQKDFDVDKTPHGLHIRLKGDLSFAPNSTELSPGAREKLMRAAAALAASTPQKKVRVEGHTDTSGSNLKNISLSKNRALAVMIVLVQNGLTDAQVTAEGFGSKRPLVDNKTSQSRSQNRRVEIYIDDGSDVREGL